MTAALLAGCGTGTQQQAATTPAATTPAPTTLAPPSRAPTATAAVASTAPPTLQLLGDGLLVSTGPAASGPGATRLAFGRATTGQARAAVQPVLGPRTGSAPADCGGRPATADDYDGFALLLRDGRLVGWAERGSAERDLETSEGVRLQSSVADLRAALPGVRITGRTWQAPSELSGLLDATGRVGQLRGGAVCEPR